MEAHTAQKYIGKTCRVNYERPTSSLKQLEDKSWVKYTAQIPHHRTGIVTNVTFRKLILLAFNGEDEDYEYYIALKNIKQVYEINP